MLKYILLYGINKKYKFEKQKEIKYNEQGEYQKYNKKDINNISDYYNIRSDINNGIARSGDGGNREIKDDSKIEVLGEDEKIIESNRTQTKESSKKWAENIKKQSVETKANDGINLRGTEYLTNEENDNWVIIFHGYRAEPKSVLTIGEHFSEKGYNVLIPSMRACAESDGDFVGMGWLDKDDLKC